jgi:hypothetical protein
MAGHQENENPFGELSTCRHTVPASTSRHCVLSSSEFLLQLLIYFKNVFEFEAPVEARSAFTANVLVVPNMVWTLAPAELSAFMVGPRWCRDRVDGHERPSVAAKLLDKLHPRLSPTWRCELGGRVWTQHCRTLHLDPPT